VPRRLRGGAIICVAFMALGIWIFRFHVLPQGEKGVAEKNEPFPAEEHKPTSKPLDADLSEMIDGSEIKKAGESKSVHIKGEPPVRAHPGKPPTLLDLFKKDFPGTASFSDKGFDLKDSDGQVGAHVDWRLLMDFVSKTEFIAFYIPPVRDEVPVCLALIDTVQPIINEPPRHLDASGGFAGESTHLRDLTFSGRVFIYHEWPLSNKQKADIVEAYSANGLDVQFRSMDYLATQLSAWHHELDK
jgi:hypothetical protein